MTFLNQLFTIFDLMCDGMGVQKVETAGVGPHTHRKTSIYP